MNILLASASPRRRQLLEWAGITVDVAPADIDESAAPGEDPVTRALRLARTKAATAPSDRLVVAADTMVHLDGAAYDKPLRDPICLAHLEALRDRWHAVTTAVCVRSGSDRVLFEVTTDVRMRAYDDAEIARYIASGEPHDKAGAYAIQGLGGALVAEVRGSWTNVMGLPVDETLRALRGLA